MNLIFFSAFFFGSGCIYFNFLVGACEWAFDIGSILHFFFK